MNIRNIIEHLLPHDAEIFAEWAWGPEFRDKILQGDWGINTWNDRHGEKIRLHGHGEIYTDIPKMIELWEDEL